jgi:hypothetical protein
MNKLRSERMNAPIVYGPGRSSPWSRRPSGSSAHQSSAACWSSAPGIIMPVLAHQINNLPFHQHNPTQTAHLCWVARLAVVPRFTVSHYHTRGSESQSSPSPTPFPPPSKTSLSESPSSSSTYSSYFPSPPFVPSPHGWTKCVTDVGQSPFCFQLKSIQFG